MFDSSTNDTFCVSLRETKADAAMELALVSPSTMSSSPSTQPQSRTLFSCHQSAVEAEKKVRRQKPSRAVSQTTTLTQHLLVKPEPMKTRGAASRKRQRVEDEEEPEDVPPPAPAAPFQFYTIDGVDYGFNKWTTTSMGREIWDYENMFHKVVEPELRARATILEMRSRPCAAVVPSLRLPHGFATWQLYRDLGGPYDASKGRGSLTREDQEHFYPDQCACSPPCFKPSYILAKQRHEKRYFDASVSAYSGCKTFSNAEDASSTSSAASPSPSGRQDAVQTAIQGKLSLIQKQLATSAVKGEQQKRLKVEQQALQDALRACSAGAEVSETQEQAKDAAATQEQSLRREWAKKNWIEERKRTVDAFWLNLRLQYEGAEGRLDKPKNRKKTAQDLLQWWWSFGKDRKALLVNYRAKFVDKQLGPEFALPWITV